MRVSKTYFMVPVREMARAVAFYHGVFDLQPTYETAEWTEISRGEGVAIALHRGLSGGQLIGLGFEVDDVEEACRRAVVAGGTLVQPMGKRIAIVADPDGNQVSVTPARRG